MPLATSQKEWKMKNNLEITKILNPSIMRWSVFTKLKSIATTFSVIRIVPTGARMRHVRFALPHNASAKISLRNIALRFILLLSRTLLVVDDQTYLKHHVTQDSWQISVVGTDQQSIHQIRLAILAKELPVTYQSLVHWHTFTCNNNNFHEEGSILFRIANAQFPFQRHMLKCHQ